MALKVMNPANHIHEGTAGKMGRRATALIRYSSEGTRM